MLIFLGLSVFMSGIVPHFTDCHDPLTASYTTDSRLRYAPERHHQTSPVKHRPATIPNNRYLSIVQRWECPPLAFEPHLPGRVTIGLPSRPMFRRADHVDRVPCHSDPLPNARGAYRRLT